MNTTLKPKKNIAIFASGNGSNFESIVQATKTGKLNANIVLLVCDKSNAFVLQRAKNHNIDTYVFDPKASSKEQYEKNILEKLTQYNIDFIALAGYMRLISTTLLNQYNGNIVNIHPSYLPNFVGKNAIQQALDSKVDTTGVTVHYVDEGMDTGPIILQKKVNISTDETLESLSQKIHALEHTIYIEALNQIL
jgi:phosphoribosylglycinamide formyltransferase-1